MLQSDYHRAWSLAVGSWHGAGTDPRYTVGTCFGTFPFPEGLTPDRSAATYAENPHAQAIAQAAQALVAARDRWLNPAELVQRIPEACRATPTASCRRVRRGGHPAHPDPHCPLHTRGKPEGAWLNALHRTLDTAVAAAYGWPADIADDDVLARLLALNQARTPA